MDNYWLVSLLSSIAKLFEKVSYNQLYAYFMTNTLFYKGQYRFREKHSTELANMELLDRVLSALNDKKLPVSIFMDLSKAFDTMDHKILLNKLKYYGINWTPLSWFMSYLSSRTQFVEINHVKSSRSSISTGVPQSSILWPLLFLIYINELPCASNLFYCILYADDTTLFNSLDHSIPLQNSNVRNYYKYMNGSLSTNSLSILTKPNLWYSILIRKIYHNLLLRWK